MKDYFPIIMSLACIGIGFLVKQFPYAMKGYGWMSAKEKKKVDRVKISDITYKGLVIGGVSLSILHYTFKFLGLHEISFVVIFLVMIIMFMLINILSLKYDHNLRTRIGIFIRIIFCILGLLGLIVSILK